MRSGFFSVRLLTSALVLSGATLVMAVGCGGSSGGGGGSPPSAGTGGDAGDTASGGDGEGGKGTAGKGSGGKGGATSTGGDAGEANAGEGGEAGAGELPPSKNKSAVSFFAAGAVSKSKNFVLISGLGESLGGTVGSKRAKSLKYTYIPGVIAALSN
jgi:hypothetical protein